MTPLPSPASPVDSPTAPPEPLAGSSTDHLRDQGSGDQGEGEPDYDSMVPGTPPISQLERRQEVALSIEHMMTHLKKCPGCEVCVQAKMQAKQARRRDPDLKFLNEQPERFGQLLWADPVIIGKKKISRGITGEKVALFICDAASELCDFPALRAKTSELITIAVQYFLGDKRGEMLYSDGAEELRVSAERLGLVHRTSTPYRPQSNGRCEVRIRGVVQGTRCLLLQAGLPHRFWPLAGRAWCFGKNVTAGDEDASAFEHVHGYSFNGQLIPFGALVLYKLNPRDRSGVPQVRPYGSAWPVRGISYGTWLQVEWGLLCPKPRDAEDVEPGHR